VLPEKIEIEIMADDMPMPGGLVDVSLSMTSKNPHTMVLGPADEQGRIVVMRSELVKRAEQNCCEWVMDYADLRKYFGGTVEVKPATLARVREMQKAFEAFSPYFKYPANWPAVLKLSEEWFAGNNVKLLTVRVEVAPPEILVNAIEASM
jgi:hypothetical protein